MRHLILILLAAGPLSTGAQSITGHYADYFGQSLVLNRDSTFDFNWAFDMERSWTKGNWTFNNKTLFLTSSLVYDTLRTKEKSGEWTDSLVLSSDQKVDVISKLFPGYLTSGGQNRMPPPVKLVFRRKKLYPVSKSGQINQTKRPNFWTRKKFKQYFRRVNN